MFWVFVIAFVVIVAANISRGKATDRPDVVSEDNNQHHNSIHDNDDWVTNPAYSFLAGNIYHGMHDD